MEIIVAEDKQEIEKYCRKCYDDGLYESNENFIGRDLLCGLRKVERIAVIPGIGWCLIYKSAINTDRIAIYVDPSYRRQGYGSELYAAATLGLNVK
jgi:GNAT superfamily N-acetyltransferase